MLNLQNWSMLHVYVHFKEYPLSSIRTETFDVKDSNKAKVAL